MKTRRKRDVRRDIVEFWRNAAGEKMTRAELDALLAAMTRKLEVMREVRRGERELRSIRIKARVVPQHTVGEHYRNVALRRRSA